MKLGAEGSGKGVAQMLLEKILLCTDFSPSSEELLKCIPELKQAGLKDVLLFHVMDPGLFTNEESELQEECASKLESIQKHLESLGLTVTTRVATGSPSERIVQEAEAENLSLIVLSSHGKGLIRSRFLGTTAFDVLRSTTTPLLIEKYIELDQGKLQAYCQNKFNKVLIPVDFSEACIEMIEKIKEIKNIREIVLVSVVEKSESQQELENRKKEWKEKLDIMEEEFVNLGYQVESHVKEGTASQNIMEVAEERQATLIALATRGAGAIDDLPIGSTIDAVARQSKNPILVFPS